MDRSRARTAQRKPKPSRPPRSRPRAGGVSRSRPGRGRREEPRSSPEAARPERLNKFLARCGVASRRGADELIAQGRVTVNGRVVREAGTRVTPGADAVVVDGAPARPEERSLVLMFYKPRGVVTTLDDPRASRTLAPWLENRGERLYPIGRLDRDSEGLLLLTNDGDLANRLTHPRYHVDKEYRVTVRGVLTPEMARRLETGIELDDGPTLPATVREAKVSGDRTRFLLVLREGRKRQIRRMCEALELPVIRLIRRRVGPIRMTRMKAGDLRPLTPSEIRRLRAAVGSPAPRPSPPRRRSRSES